MTYDELRNHVKDFFGDTSRSAEATKRDLLSLRDEIEMFIETLPTSDALEIEDEDYDN